MWADVPAARAAAGRPHPRPWGTAGGTPSTQAGAGGPESACVWGEWGQAEDDTGPGDGEYFM